MSVIIKERYVNMVNNKKFSIKGFNGEYILESLKEYKPIYDIMLQNNIDSKEIEAWINEFTKYASSLRGELIDYEYLRAIGYHTKNIINFVDIETHEILYMNRACREDYRVPDDGAYKYKKCYEVFYGNDSPCDFCTFKELQMKQVAQWKAFNPISKKYYMLSDKLLNIHGRKVRIEIGIDIHEETNERLMLDNKARVDNTLFECIRALAVTVDFNEAIEKMLGIVCKFYNGNRGYIFEVDEGGATLSNTYEWCQKGVTAEKDNLQKVPIDTADYWFDTFKEKGTFFISKLTKGTKDYEILEAQGINSLMATPLVENGTIKGFLGVDDPRESIEDFSLLSSITYFVINDIQKRRFITELENLSFRDTMTQLSNRNKFIRDLEIMHNNPPGKIGVVYIDLNGLKVANDKYGHAHGDLLLTQLASAMKQHFTNHLYRIGGDEFVVLCVDMKKEDFNKAVEAFRETIDNHSIVSASIGEAWAEKEYNLKELVKYADSLMYANKQVYYSSNGKMNYNQNTALTSKLLSDLDQGNYVISLKPKKNVNSNIIVGAETIIKNFDKEPIEAILPNCDNRGASCHLDFYVLNKMCKLISDLEAKGKSIGKLTIYFCQITLLEHNVVDHILDICNKNNVSPSSITIGLSEDIANMPVEGIVEVAIQIKKAGFGIAIELLGAKYSNISTLSQISFDEIKIEKKVMKEILYHEKTKKIAKYIINTLQDLGKCLIVSEGIESLEEVALLKEAGLEFEQGCYFLPPVSIDEFIEKYI